jgi:hypothetical protein
MANGNLFMAHRCGFTQKVLTGTLQQTGFKSVATMARGRAPFLICLRWRENLSAQKLRCASWQVCIFRFRP